MAKFRCLEPSTTLTCKRTHATIYSDQSNGNGVSTIGVYKQTRSVSPYAHLHPCLSLDHLNDRRRSNFSQHCNSSFFCALLCIFSVLLSSFCVCLYAHAVPHSEEDERTRCNWHMYICMHCLSRSREQLSTYPSTPRRNARSCLWMHVVSDAE